MKYFLASMLALAVIDANAQALSPVESLLNSGDPTQATKGYQQCNVLMTWVGNAAAGSNPQEGASYIAVGKLYGKLYRNATDIRALNLTDVSTRSAEVAQKYLAMVKSEKDRPTMLKDVEFCQKWVEH